jgi:hypothetical protein
MEPEGVQNSPPLVPILSQINPFDVLPVHVFKIRLIMYSHLCLDVPSGLSFRFSHQYLFASPHVVCTVQDCSDLQAELYVSDPYRAVNTLHVGYTNQSVNVVQ